MSGFGRKSMIPRKVLEAGTWVILIMILWGTDLFVKMSERNQAGIGKDDFKLISEQVTSAVAVLLMILFVVRWLRMFPLRRDVWAAAVTGHTFGSIVFAFGHHALMIAMRIPWYGITGRSYVWREPFVANLIVEYQKDIKIYFGIVVIVTAYQMYCRLRTVRVPTLTDRLVVQTGSGDSVLRFDQVDYLEAAANYVSVYANGREYVVRDTMANLMAKLGGGPFMRVHRSFIVNVDKIKEIRAADSKQSIVLLGGQDVPLSRRYRKEFFSRIGG